MTESQPCCVRCGKPGPGLDQHHHPPLGSGGSPDWQGDLISLCRRCHELIHRGQELLQVTGGMVYGYAAPSLAGDKPLWSRPLVPADEAETLPVPRTPSDVIDQYAFVRERSDNQLYDLFGDAQAMPKVSRFYKGMIADEFYTRYGHYGDAWGPRMANQIADHTGIQLSVSHLYDCLYEFRAFREEPHRILELPSEEIRQIARDHHALEAGREVRSREEAEPWVCPTCGHSHRERPAELGLVRCVTCGAVGGRYERAD